ncbi:hypothetical protein Mapa_001060 [Marchantia paleacea]|nr:hypothetical protein Mapa_001060 [Marchantia paleacea]
MLPLKILLFTLLGTGVTLASAEEREGSSGISRSKWASKFGVLADLQRGDMHEAVADLKQYLSKFGYIKLEKEEDLSLEFDELLMDAIKLYQVNHNIPVTGVLSNHTLRLLHTPRCGRADVEEGRPLMFERQQLGKVGLPASVPGHLENFESHWAVYAPSEKWQSNRNLTIAFSSTDVVPSVSETDAKAAILAAFAAWSRVIPVNFTETNNYTEADIEIRFVGGDHGDGDPFDGRLGILAHAFAPEDGRFHFDKDEVWTVDVDSTDDEDAIDLQTVALHEIGHLLGLAHTHVEGAVMYPSIVTRQVKRQLTVDDIQGAQALYGSKYHRPLSTACQDHSTQEAQYGADMTTFGTAGAGTP